MQVSCSWRVPPPRAESDAAEILAICEQASEEGQQLHVSLREALLPWHIARPTSDLPDSQEAAASPCELTLLELSAARCARLDVHVVSNARHVEIYAHGARRNLLGEMQVDDVYFGTFRGDKMAAPSRAGATDDARLPLFAIHQVFDQQQSACEVLRSIDALRFKFVSLQGDKNLLQVHALECCFIGVEAKVPSIDSTAAAPSAQPSAAAGAELPRLLEQLALSPGNPANSSSISSLLLTLQQTLQQDMEAKLTQALDAKLAMLSQRLAFSEQMLLQLHDRTKQRDAQVDAKLDRLQHELVQLRAACKNPPSEVIEDRSADATDADHAGASDQTDE